MSTDNFGPGVSRVLDPVATQYDTVIWQADRPPLDSELNLLQQLAFQGLAQKSKLDTPSGWLSNTTNPSDVFQTDWAWSNYFRFGRQRAGEKRSIQWAVVNGWLIPVTGTKTGTPPGTPDDTSTWNRITLDPPPLNAGDQRVDFVFLEVWRARVPTGAASSKPSATAVYRYGNVEGGMTYLPDDLQDPEIGTETTQRVQVQYRVRVVTGLIGLATYPEGFDPTKVKAQGLAANPTSYTFTNMRQELDDPGLWRSGDGSQNAMTALGTVDGYTYAIPLAFVFRRNGVAWNGDPAPNLNGGFNRNPTAVSRANWKDFTTLPTLATDLTATGLSATLVAYPANTLPLPATPAVPVTVRIGNELLTYQSVAGTTLTLVARGVNGTRAEEHKAGDVVELVSGRPDGLFADQIAGVDILDARHVVNVNGFDYQALLQANLSKLLRGDMQSVWKRTAATQGPWLHYQDKVTNSPVALSVAKLDGPNLVRRVWSDASTVETVEVMVTPAVAPVVFPAVVQVATPWSLNLPAETTGQAIANQFNAGDVIRIPISTFQQGLNADTDQVRFVNDGISYAVEIRRDGRPDTVDASLYTVTPTNPDANDPLVITFQGGGIYPLTGNLSIKVRVLYGPGRGTSRKYDSLHGLSMLTNAAGEYMLAGPTVPATNVPLRTAWLPLWSRFRNAAFQGSWPITAEAYADAASKTIAIQPFRRITFPGALTQDGSIVNLALPGTGTGGNTGTSNATTTFTDLGADFIAGGVMVGAFLVIDTGPAKGTYIVTGVALTTLTVDRVIPTAPVASINYSVINTISLGLMPTQDIIAGAKWGNTDPLELFAGSVIGPNNNINQRNLYVTLPRHLVPGWGDVLSPCMLAGSSPIFDEGLNFGLQSKVGNVYSDINHNPQYINYANGGFSFAVFSTHNLTALPATVAATYNAVTPSPGIAGMRFYNDGLRRGLELPPFYGIARLWAVYEAQDYATNGSAYVAATRSPVGVGSPAVNLLKQNFQGPYFFITKDADGDSTFVLNPEALDLGRSAVVPIPTFEQGRYVIEASIFGFDRGSFNVDQDFRLVLSRNRTIATDSITRSNNLGVAAPGVTAVLPGPLSASDGVVINYSRVPYQGDAWGSTTVYNDLDQRVGPLSSSQAYQLSTTRLDETQLTRPNQKTLEVLASLEFQTTAGTGRLGMEPSTGLDLRNIGYEDPQQYPPVAPASARPRLTLNALANMVQPFGTDLAGCTERLPLGSLFRDKDFRGEDIYLGRSALSFSTTEADFAVGPLSPMPRREINEVPVQQGTVASGTSGDLVVHVDGEQQNYALLTNYRTTRGGSAFSANAPRPGSEIAAWMALLEDGLGHMNVLSVKAMLVRNTPTVTQVGEVSAGSELMMLIITQAQRVTTFGPMQGGIRISTNGTEEGYSAADLYRLEGHPLLRDHVRVDFNPNVILTPRA